MENKEITINGVVYIPKDQVTEENSVFERVSGDETFTVFESCVTTHEKMIEFIKSNEHYNVFGGEVCIDTRGEYWLRLETDTSMAYDTSVLQ